MNFSHILPQPSISKPKCPSLLDSLHKVATPPFQAFCLFFQVSILLILLHLSQDVETKLPVMLRIWAYQFLEWCSVVLSCQALSAPKDNLTNYSKEAKHFCGFLSASQHSGIDFRAISEVPFWVLGASSEYSIMSAWFILLFSRCVTSRWTSPADFWSAQFYDVLLEILAIEGIKCEQRTYYYPQTWRFYGSLPLCRTQMKMMTKTGPSNNLHSERFPLVRPIHWFLSSKKLSSNPMAT